MGKQLFGGDHDDYNTCMCFMGEGRGVGVGELHINYQEINHTSVGKLTLHNTFAINTCHEALNVGCMSGKKDLAIGGNART